MYEQIKYCKIIIFCGALILMNLQVHRITNLNVKYTKYRILLTMDSIQYQHFNITAKMFLLRKSRNYMTTKIYDNTVWYSAD